MGVLTATDAFDRLHYVGPASVLGGSALAAAVLVTEGLGANAVRAVLTVVVLQAATALTTHATARAGEVRGDLARLRERDGEIVEP